MSLEDSFGRIVDWFARPEGEVDPQRTEPTTTETLLASVEYELQQLARDFAEVRLDRAPPRF